MDVLSIGEGEEPKGDEDYEATVEKIVEEAKKYGDLSSSMRVYCLWGQVFSSSLH